MDLRFGPKLLEHFLGSIAVPGRCNWKSGLQVLDQLLTNVRIGRNSIGNELHRKHANRDLRLRVRKATQTQVDQPFFQSSR